MKSWIQNGDKKRKICTMTLGKSLEDTISCGFINFVENRLFGIKVSPGLCPLPGIGLTLDELVISGADSWLEN